MKTIYIFIILSIIFKQLNMYKYRVKGKDMTFDTSQLNEKDKLRWEKLGKIGKLRMIESYKLNDNAGVPGDYIDVKTVKDKPQNERYAKLRIEEQKKTELDKLKQANDLNDNTAINDVENAMSDEQKTLFKDDLSKLKKDNQNPTLSDLMKIYVNKIEQLTTNEIGTINAKNVDTINASSVNKLLFDVKTLTDELVNPLRPILENIIERHGDDRDVLQLADRNDIQGIQDRLNELHDDETLNQLNEQIRRLQNKINQLAGVFVSIGDLQQMVNSNDAKLNRIIQDLQNEFNPVKRLDIMNAINTNRASTAIDIDELRGMIEQLMNEKLTKDDVKEIINDADVFNDLKQELIKEFGDKAKTVIDKIDESQNEEEKEEPEDKTQDIKNELIEIKNILSTKPEHKDITIDEIKTALTEDREALKNEIDETFNDKFKEYREAVMGKSKLPEKENDILKGVFNDLVNKYPGEFVSIAKGELSDEKHKKIVLDTFNVMKTTLIGALNDLIATNSKCVIGISNGETRTGNINYLPYITFNEDNWDALLIDAIKSNENLRILPSATEKSSSQLSKAYVGYDKMIELMKDFVNQNQIIKTVSGSIFSKIKGKLTSDDVKKNINNLNSETQLMKNDFKELKDEIKELKDEIKDLTNELKELKSKPKIEKIPPPPPKIPETKHETKPSSRENDFLNDIIKRKELKHVEIDEKPIPKDSDDGIVSNLKDIMKRRREDIEPDEYSEDEEVDWAAGINKRKMLTYAQFKELFG